MDREEQEGLIQSHDSSHGRQSHSVRKARIILLVCAILVFAVAFVAGFFVRQNVSRTLKRSKQTGRGPEKYHHNILMQMKAENIEKNLRDLTYVQHIAGSDDDVTQSHFIYERWKKFLGAENIQLKKYEVLLSYPVKPGNVSIYDEKKKEIIFTSHPNESRLWPDENVPNVRVPFNAYSPSGNVKGKLIYVNYGRAEDFKNLAALNISCEGKILLARYGKIFRGNKVALGEKAGAIGMIVFNDPSDYARGKTTYPDSWWLPPDGVQRGAIVIHEGDPLTPGYPATERKMNGQVTMPG